MRIFYRFKYLYTIIILTVLFIISMLQVNSWVLKPLLISILDEVYFYQGNQPFKKDLTTLQQNLTKSISFFNKVDSTMITSDAEFLSYIHGLAQAKEIQVLSTNSSTIHLDSEYNQLDYELRLNGNFSNIYTYIREIEIGKRPISILKMEIQGSGLQNRVDISLVLRTWKRD